MHLFDGKKAILGPNKGLVFRLMPQLSTFYLGPTPQAAKASLIVNTDYLTWMRLGGSGHAK